MACQIDCTPKPPFCGNANIQFEELCVKHVKSCCLDSAKVVTDNLCARHGSVVSLDSNEACINHLKANDACINQLKVNDLQQCGKYRATVAYSVPSMYTLGDKLAFDVVLDDPNGNVVTGLPWTSYTAPLSGYYNFMLEIDLHDFVIAGEPVLGTPVANPKVLVNGAPFRQGFSTFLAFHNGQRSLIAGLMSLKMGDIVTCSYDAVAVNDVGFHNLVGSATISGNGSEADQSAFKIHYLSSDCNESPLCMTCTAKTECVPCAMP